MAVKRKHDAVEVPTDRLARPAKEAKRGFSVGPANLPDGIYRRKGRTASPY